MDTTPPPLPADSRPIRAFDDPREWISGYAVRDDGTILYYAQRRRRWLPLVPKIGPGGFRKVRLVIKGREREIGVAQLVLRAFAGPRPIGHEPLHFPDPDPGNNRLANLRWAPRGASKVGRQLGPTPPPNTRGSQRVNAVLTEPDIPEIRRMYRDGFRYREIAEDLGVAEETIRQVLIGRTWTHVPDPVGPIVMRRGPDPDAASHTKLDWDTVRAIRQAAREGASYRQLADRFSISKSTIRDIIKGWTWKDVT